jgi:hypothetical protein
MPEIVVIVIVVGIAVFLSSAANRIDRGRD